MSMNEAETRAKLIDPAIKAVGCRGVTLRTTAVYDYFGSWPGPI